MMQAHEQAQFQRLKLHFYALAELSIADRQTRLSALEGVDEGFRVALEDLLAHVDESDLLPAAELPFIGQRIGPFELINRIGSGGMGEVFAARRVDGSFEQVVAIKLVRAGTLSGELARRFLRERQILARLTHPGIAHLLDGGIAEDGRPWLAMEQINGLPISEWCAQQKSTLAERVALLCEVCAAVQFAHEHLIVHRDLKPANVLIDARGAPKLLDFGIAKLLDDETFETHANAHVGTPRYAAPEQLSGGAITTAVDIYALGMMLFELLTGATPYPSAERSNISWREAALCAAPESLLRAALRSEPRATAEQRHLSGDLNAIVQRALAKNPRERYPSAASFADDLQDWLNDRPLRSGVGGAVQQLRKLLKRYRWPAALLASVLLSLSIGLLLVVREAREAQRQRAVAEANLNALIEVLASSAPLDFVGRERSASELLLAAATQLQSKQYPLQLQRRALTQIGHGLLNLGRMEAAEPILQIAADAAEREAGVQDKERLALLKLLVFAQAFPEARQRAQRSAQRIGQMVRLATSQDARGVDALASAAGVLSWHSEFADAEHLLAQIDPQKLATFAPEVRENVARQRGWVALRQAKLTEAERALGEARELMISAPKSFSPLRLAEGELLLAETALLNNETARADALLSGASETILAEYPKTHPERAGYLLLAARAAPPDQALRWAQTAVAILAEQPAQNPRQQISAALTLAQAQARNQRCSDAQSGLALVAAELIKVPAQPRERLFAAQVREAFEQACAGATAGDIASAAN